MAMLAQTGEQFWPRLLGEAGTLDLSAIFAPVLVPPQDGFLPRFYQMAREGPCLETWG